MPFMERKRKRMEWSTCIPMINIALILNVRQYWLFLSTVGLPNLKIIKRMNTDRSCFVNMKNISIPCDVSLPSKQDNTKTVLIPSSVVIGRYTIVLCAESKMTEDGCSSRYSVFM